MTYDWKDPRREDTFHFLLVDPHNLDIVRGEIPDVILEDTSITHGYDTDTRSSGKITILSSDIMNSWVRIVHEVRKWGYRSEMGTFIPVSPGGKKYSGAEKRTYDMQSTLWAIKGDLCPTHFAVGTGAYSNDAIARICDGCRRDYIISAGANNYRYTSTKVYEMGDSYFSELIDICDRAGNRYDVDGHGRIVVSKYVSPKYITASWDLNYDDPRSMIQSDGIDISSTDYDTPNRIIVIYQNDNTEIYAYADAPSTYVFSAAQRGYIMADVHSVSDMSPATLLHAQALSHQYLEESMTGTTEYKMRTMYFPGKIGETVNLQFDGKNHHCLLKSIDPINLKEMTMDITLQEA